MGYDEALAGRVRSIMRVHEDAAEREMFGGLAWMLRGNTTCCVLGSDVAVRLSLVDADRALEEDYTRPFDTTGRPVRGFVVVAGHAVAAEADLARWIDAAAEHALSLPPK
jgi:hypothetical protein